MASYYSENNPIKAVWLRRLIAAGLIADGEVDERSVADVQPGDLRGFVQCHFFAGIGGWSYALRLASWPDAEPVWTFSCPCRKFSSAARGRTVAPDLWHEQRRLLTASRPRVFFGEQVAAASDWFDALCADMEALDYQVGAAILPAVSVGLDHARPRIFFVGHTDRDGESSLSIDGEMARLSRHRREFADVGEADGLPGELDLLRGFGDAIVAPVAAEFIGAYIDCQRVNEARCF